MRALGYFLFFAGVIIASVFASPKEPKWILFSVFIAVSIVGSLLVRFVKKSSPEKEESSDPTRISVKSLKANISEISSMTRALSQKAGSDSLTLDAIKKEIENIQSKMMYFIDNRQYVQDMHGIATYSEIYISFAGGERNLSRAWSALVDNHEQEMKNSLESAGSRLEETARLYEKLSG